MNVTSFDALTRHVGATADRRSALTSLAAVAFVTGIAASRPAETRKRSKKNAAMECIIGEVIV